MGKRKYKRLHYEDRQTIEAMSKQGSSVKAIKGYYVDKNSVSMGVHSPEYYGYGYLRYTLVKITDKGG